MMSTSLNERAFRLVEALREHSEQHRVIEHSAACGGRIIDCGIEAEGGLSAGLALANVCLAGLAKVSLVNGEVGGVGWPVVQVATDRPVQACLLSQYAGWQISVDKFFGMGSGPMRAAAAVEELFTKLSYQEHPQQIVGVLETGQLPDDSVFRFIVEKTGVKADHITLLVAPTSSAAGNFQVVARSVETSLHKLFEVGFDVRRIRSAYGTAPLSPVAADDLTGIGRTNDAILYGGRVVLYVHGDDESLTEIGPRVPSSGSECFGRPFVEIFEQAGRDFYRIDPHLFSPAEIVFQNLDTGNVHRFGAPAPEVLQKSFGVSTVPQ